ncbi:hybrid sensor histidine kinase/response regulator [Corallococcus sp. H22C18031201]|nr:hybrid sensor histidine kinase/response regulator [Corallococcus sp. H22C18031201]
MPDLPFSAHAAVFEHTRDGVLVLDRAHRIVDVNRAAENVFGERSVLLGMAVEQVLPGWLPPTLDADGGIPRETVLVWPPTGSLRVLSVPQRDASGQVGGWALMLRDLVGSLEAEATLRHQKEFSEAVIRNSPVAIVTISREFRVLSWNPAAERLFGFTPQEALGRNILHLVANVEPIRPVAEQTSREVLQLDRVHSVTQRVRKDGSVVDVELLALPVAVGGQPVGFIAIYHDITDLQRARQAAEAANQAKSLFLATMSHEIRTPMNAIIGMAGLLLDTALTPEQRDFVTTIRQSGDALLSLLNDMLDFSKIEAGRVELESNPFDLRQCVESVLDLLAVRASEKGLDLGYHVAAATPSLLEGDAARLRQVLLNLVGNAVKFTERGGVVLSVDVLRAPVEPGDPFELRFTVQDTGLGIPENRRAGLFQPFNQLDASVSRRFGGTGLGLAISKRLVEMMGGRIWVESEGIAGRGSTFHFLLPARAAPQASLGGPRLEQPVLRGRRVLVVDDNAINRKLLNRQLVSWGMEPVEAGSGAEALARLESGGPFDLAILDHRMPLLDGPTLAGIIRGQEAVRELPLLLLTSFDQRDAQPPGLFFSVLSRPVKSSQLYDAVMKCLSHDTSPSMPAPPPPRATREGSIFGERPAAISSLRILLVEDNPTNQKLALLVLDRLGYRADVAVNGRAALQSLEQRVYDVVFMDVQMPEMDGLETTRRVRRDVPAAVQPHIIAMTANAMAADRRECLDAGMDDFLSKPIRVEELIAALRRVQPRLEVAPVTAAPVIPRIEGLDPAALTRLWHSLDGQVERMLPEIIDTALHSMPKLLDDARAALSRGQSDDLGRAAHTLKSNAAYFGVTGLESVCHDVERSADAGVLDGLAERLEQCQGELLTARRLLESLRESVAARATG